MQKYPDHCIVNIVMCFSALLLQFVRILQTLIIYFTTSVIIFSTFQFSPTHWWDLSLLSLSLYIPQHFLIFHVPYQKTRAFICVRFDCAIWRKVKPSWRSKRYLSVGRFFLCFCCFHQHDTLEFVPPKSLNFCQIYI